MTAQILLILSISVTTLLPFSVLGALLLLPGMVLLRHIDLPRDVTTWVMLGLIAWLPASLVWSISPGLSLAHIGVLLCLPLGWLTGHILRAKHQLDKTLSHIIPLLLLVLSIWGISQKLSNPEIRPTASFIDTNAYAAFLILLLVPRIADYFNPTTDLKEKKGLLVKLLLIGAAWAALLTTASRGALLAILLVLPIILWQARKASEFKYKLILIFAVAIAANIAIQLISSNAINVTHRLAQALAEGNPARLMLFNSAWSMIKENPVLGTGLGSFRLRYPQHRSTDEISTAGGWVHNDYLQLWVEVGLPAILLIFALAYWLISSLIKEINRHDERSLTQVGYMAGCLAVFIHATVNFIFYFAPISLLLGLYMSRIGSTPIPRNTSSFANLNQAGARLSSNAYALILGYLFIGNLAVDSISPPHRITERVAKFFGVTYNRYDAAYWTSILAPFHPSPQQIMGIELSDGFLFTGMNILRDEALSRMQTAMQLAPCYMPFANDALALIRHGTGQSPEQLEVGKRIISTNLKCNPRHGLTYYHAGSLALGRSENDALKWWKTGLSMSPFPGDRLLLATALLSRKESTHQSELAAMASRMAESIRSLESNPAAYSDQKFWDDSLRRLDEIVKNDLQGLIKKTPEVDQNQPQ